MLKPMPKPQADLDRTFQALADGKRRAILARLGQGPASVGELAKPLAMSLPGVLQHLQVLEASGLVTSIKLGRVRQCHLVPEALREAEAWFSQQRRAWEGHLDALGAFLLAQEAVATEPEA